MAKKKDDPFAYLQELIAQPRPVDPYASLKSSIPVAVSSSDSAKQILSKLGTVQTNRAVLEALGAEEKPKTKRGIVSKLLDPEKGLLFAPARFGGALVADVTGLGEKAGFRSELRGNPLTSAIRSARGEFAITGGDIIPVKERDNILTRGGKLLGALAWDLATDPTSYLGGATSLSRRSLVETAANPEVMKKVIRDVEASVAQRALPKSVSDDIVADLVRLNRRFVDGEITIVTTGRGANKTHTVVNTVNNAPLSLDDVKEIAATSLSELVSSGLVTRGRAGILDNLSAVLDTKKTPGLAQEIFDTALPVQLQGGLWLVNPITGTRYKKIIGGHGGGNAATELVNAARFKSARGARDAIAMLSGEYGDAWAAAMKDLHKDIVRTKSVSSRNLITDYMTFKNTMNKKALIVERMSQPAVNWAKQSTAVQEDIEQKFGKKAAKTFKDRLAYYAYESQDYTPEQIADVLARAENTGAMRSGEYANLMAEVWGIKAGQIFKAYADELEAAGVKIGRQKKFFPLMYKPEMIDYLRTYEPRQGKDIRAIYNAENPRVTFETPVDPEALATMLDDNPALFDAPWKANERARLVIDPETKKKVEWFDTDLIPVMARYGDYASNRIATERTVRALEVTGVVTRYKDELLQQVNDTNAQVWLDTAKTLDANSRAKLQTLVDEADRKLREMTDQSFVKEENRKRAEVLAATQKRYDEAVEVEMNTFHELVQIEKFLRDNDILADDVLDTLMNGLPDIDRAILERVLADIKSAQKRASRWKSRLDEAVKEYDAAKKARTKARAAATKAKTQVDPSTGKRVRVTVPQAIKDALENAEDAFEVAEGTLLDSEAAWIQSSESVKSLANDRAAIRQAIASADAERVAKARDLIAPYLAALDRKQILVAKLAVEKEARLAARVARNTAKIDVINLNSKGISVAISNYARHRQNFKNIAYELRQTARENWTIAQKREFNYRKNLALTARRKLIKAIGYSAGGKQTAGREYARILLQLVQDKTDNEIALLRFFSNDDAIDTLVRRVMSQTEDSTVRLQAMQDLMRAYSYLRRTVTNEDLAKLGSLEQDLFLRRGKARPIERVVAKPTARISVVMDDLKRARARKDTASIKRLNTELKRLKSMASKEGRALVGADVTGFQTPRALRDLYAPSGVREIMERMWKVREDPDDWNRYIRDFYDPLAFLWKTQATVGRGFGYIFNNIIGGATNNYIYGVTIKDHKEAAGLLNAFFDARSAVTKKAVSDGLAKETFNELVTKEFAARLKDLKIGEYDAIKILTEFMGTGAWFSTETVATLRDIAETGLASKIDEAGAGRLGIAFDWQDMPASEFEQRFRAFVDFMLTNPVQRFFNDLAQRSEVFVRLAAFIRGYKNFGNTQSALSVVHALHFDYKDLSNAEQWVKRFVPFYTWNRYNIPFQMRALFFAPDKIKRLALINENFQKAFSQEEEDSWVQELLPEWVDVQGGFLSGASFLGNPIGLFPRLPIYDLDKISQVGSIHGFPIIMPRMQQVAGMLGPIVTPLEFITGVNFDTGLKYQDETEKWTRIATNLAPIWGTVSRAGRAATVPLSIAGVDLPDFIKQERGMTDLLNLTVGGATGYSAFTFGEKQLMSGLLDTIESQNEQVKQIAAEANISLDWLRDQIKAGKSLAEIRILIAQGKGNAQMWQQIESLEGFTAPKRDYQAMIQGLRSGQPVTGYSSPS